MQYLHFLNAEFRALYPPISWYARLSADTTVNVGTILPGDVCQICRVEQHINYHHAYPPYFFQSLQIVNYWSQHFTNAIQLNVLDLYHH